MKRTPFTATHSAILGFLEHVEGIDVAAAKEAIERRVEFADDHDGADAVLFGGMRYTLNGEMVTSVHPQSAPSIKTGRAKR